MKRKITALFLASLMIVEIPIPVLAETHTKQQMVVKVNKAFNTDMPYFAGNFVYCLDENNQAMIIDYTGSMSGQITIPEKIGTGEYPVVALKDQLFYNQSDITGVTLPDTITSIGSYAFSGCSALSELLLPAALQTIGTYAFQGTGITAITIPSTVTKANYAFNGSTSLTTITFASGMQTVPASICYNCKNLATVNLPASVTTIGASAFNMCGSLQSITLPDGLTTIESQAFSECEKLSAITLPSSVKTLGSSVFAKSGLLSITIPKSLESSSDPFSGCNKLATAAFEVGTTSILNRLFYNCTSLVTVNIPDTVTEIGQSAFAECTSLENVTLSKNLATIDTAAFYNCAALAKLSLPGGVTTLGEQAFSKTGITSIVIPKGVTTANQAFKECGSLTSATFEQGIAEIPEYIFQDCTALEEVTIPTSVTTIGSHAFCNCAKLSDVVLSNSITTIEENAFSDCIAIDTIQLPSSLVTLETSAFSKTGLTSVVIPKSVKDPLHKSRGAFSDCAKLTTITFEQGTTTISSYSTANCPALNTINIPDSVTTIESRAFWNNPKLTSITIPESVTEAAQIFYLCDALTEITFQSGMTIIPDEICSGLKGLQTIHFPASVTTIGSSSFSDCIGFIDVTIPDTVTNIKTFAFNRCTNLQSITLSDHIETIENGAFDVCTSLQSITIPKTLKHTYGAIFNECSALTNVVLESGLEVIPYGIFERASALTSVTIPNTVTTIEDNAFRECIGLNQLSIPISVVSIDDAAFLEMADSFTLSGISGSAAHQYAIKYKIPFRSEGTLSFSINYVNVEPNTLTNPCTYYSDTTLILKSVARTGYTFCGWYSDANFTKRVTKFEKGSTGNATLYAKWSLNKYTVKFNGNGATSGSMASISCKYGFSYKLAANTFKRTGYTFVGWNTRADGKGTSYKNAVVVKNLLSSTGTRTLYACWKVNSYTVTYKLNGGTNSRYNPTRYTYETATITMKNPTRTGYTFAGWYKDASLKTKVKTITKHSTGNRVMYAKWTANKYTVQFKGNGATSGSMKKMTSRTYGKSFTLTKNTFKRKNTRLRDGIRRPMAKERCTPIRLL